MKRILPIFALLAGPVLAAENAVPAAFSTERYEKMVDKSPFALATPVVAPPAPQAGFAANWYLTGVGRDDQGNDFVTIVARDQSVHFSLVGREANVETGVVLVSVNWADGFKKSTAIIKKGTETAKVEFSQDEPMVVAQPGGPKPGLPVAPPALPPVTVRAGSSPQGTNLQPRTALPRPSGNPVTTPVTMPVTQPSQTGLPPGSPVAQPPGENRRRVRNIPSPAGQ